MRTASISSAVVNCDRVCLILRFFRPRIEQLGAMTAFRDPAAIEAGMKAVLSGNVSLVDGFPLLSGVDRGKTFLSIYEIKGDRMRICYDLSGQKYPAEFKSTKGTQLFLVNYRREKKQQLRFSCVSLISLRP